jgi:hypothetical protein
MKNVDVSGRVNKGVRLEVNIGKGLHIFTSPEKNTEKKLPKVFNKSFVNMAKGLRMGRVAGICECGNELYGSIKFGEFLD